jgi:hypothetical protein
MHKARSLTLAVVTSTLIGLGLAAPANAAPTVPLVDWEMNEPAGATTMLDSGPNHINGTLGTSTNFHTGVVAAGATGYSWDAGSPTAPPPKPERLIQIQDGRLNAGTRDISVTIRYRATHSYGNIIQKGQNQTPGGYFKFEQPAGFMHCLFKGSIGSKVAKSPVATNDGAWHTFTCVKTATSLTMTVDGTQTVTVAGKVGSISNSIPMTIAGKLNCDQVNVSCDYFAGGLDYVKISTS